LKRIFTFISLMIFFYIPNSGLIGVPVFLSFIFIMINIYKFKKLDFITSFFTLIYFLIAYSLTIIFIRQSGDIHFFVLFSKFLIYYLGFSSLLRVINLSNKEILEILYIVLFINVLVSIIQYFDLFNLRYFFMNINKRFIHDKFYNYESQGIIRTMGLFGGFDTNGIFLTFNFLLGSMLFFNSKRKFNKAKYIIMNIIIVLTIFTTSRTGLIALIIGSFILFFITKNIVVSNIKLLIISAPILVFSINLIKEKFTELFNKTYNFMFEALINYSNYGVLETSSTNKLFNNHYFLPKKTDVLLFGNSFSNNNLYGPHSDVAYVQIIFGLGLFSLLVLLFFGIRFLFDVIKLKRINNIKFVDDFSNYIIIVFLLIWITSFKGPYLLSQTVMMFYIFNYSFFKQIKKNFYRR